MIAALSAHFMDESLPDGEYYDELMDAGLIHSVHWWEADNPDHNREGFDCYSISERGWRYLTHFGYIDE